MTEKGLPPEWRGVAGQRIVIPHGRPDVMLVEIKTLSGPVRPQRRWTRVSVLTYLAQLFSSAEVKNGTCRETCCNRMDRVRDVLWAGAETQY